MKKVLSLLLVSASVFGVLSAEGALVLSIDRNELFTKSKVGQIFLQKQEKLKSEAEADLKKLEQGIRESSQRLEKQAAMLTTEALTEKQRDLAKKMRNFEREREDKQQDLKLTFQLGYEKLRNEQYKVAEAVFKSKEGKLLVDQNAPGVLAVSADADITPEVLKKLDSDFEKSTIIEKKA